MTPPRASRWLAIAVLVLAGCSPATPTPEPTPSPTPASGLSELALAYLVPLPGYEYVALPPEVELQASNAFQAPAIKPYLNGYVIRSVTHNAEAAAVAMVLEFELAYLALPNAMSSFVGGIAGSAGQVEQSTIGSHDVYGVTNADVSYLTWQDGPLVVVLVGTDTTKMLAVAEAMIAAHT